MSLTEKESKQIINITNTLIEASEHFLQLVKQKKYSESLYIFSSIIEGYNVVQHEIDKDKVLKNKLTNIENRIIANIKSISNELEKNNLLKVNEFLQFSFVPTLKKWKSQISELLLVEENGVTTIGVYEDRFNPIDGYRKERVDALVEEAKNANVILFFFTSSDVNFETEKISGTYREGDQWVKREFPFPDVIHNIFPKFFARQSKVERRLRKQIPFTSFSFGDKLDLPKKIVKNKKFAELLVPFKIISSENEVFNFLTKNQIAVLKPIRGARGENIYFVQQKGQRFRVTERRKTKIMNKEEFSFWLNSTVLEKKDRSTYMIQKFIEAKTKEGNPYDFRIHMQKNGEGKWQITKLYPRIGSTKSMQIEIYRDGQDLLDPKEFLYEQFGEEGFEMLERMKKLSLEVTFHIDKLYGLAIDEMGLDIAIDQNKRFWMFEANNGPQTHLHERERAINTIAYCKYIAKNKIFYTNEFSDSRLWTGFFDASKSTLERISDNRVKIGAIVGTNVNNDLIKLLTYVSEFKNITLFTFDPKDVDNQSNLIKGKLFKNNHTVELIFPYPDIIIDILNEKDNYKFVYEEFENIPFMYSKISNHIHLAQSIMGVFHDKFIIPKQIASNVQEVLTFLNTYKQIKISLPNNSEEHYTINKQSNGHVYEVITNKFKKQLTKLSLEYFLEDLLKEENIVVQKYYKKPRINNLEFAFCLRFMKNSMDMWECTNIKPLFEVLGGPEQFVTMTTELNRFLENKYPINHNSMLKKISNFGDDLSSGLNKSNLDLHDISLEVILDDDQYKIPKIVNASIGKLSEIKFNEAVTIIEYIEYITTQK